MRILDLCCGAGLASIGYKIAFPDAEISGWDIKDMSSSYPFNFNLGDAFALDYEYLDAFDLIHISPPCQRYSKVTPKQSRGNHPHLIPNAMRLCASLGKPYVVENVPGSTQWLRPNVSIKAGGKVRLFNTSIDAPGTHNLPECVSIMSSGYVAKRDIVLSWGIPMEYEKRLTMAGIRQGIPPKMITWLMGYWHER